MPNINEIVNQETGEVITTVPSVDNEEASQTAANAQRITNPIYEGVRVKKTAVQLIKALVKAGFFRKSPDQKKADLLIVNRELSRMYNVAAPTVLFGDYRNCYRPDSHTIYLTNQSVISFLHEFRHHLQHFGNKYENMDIEEDARAWSLRVFSKAVPRIFENSVRRGIIMFVRWDAQENRIVNDTFYPDAQNQSATVSAEGDVNYDTSGIFQVAPERVVLSPGAANINQIMNDVITQFNSDGTLQSVEEE